ncbi:hypothetical protein ACCI51_09305 [Microbulbifer echini]|uniref:DUF3757 domain-containing protein n=1 Tax=Microbulbifer echini TaxID=1529067 RepID=A0ABV4NNV6_9GAMM|nr:hypothetical protein [uncultured Microbulbifer sp.]
MKIILYSTLFYVLSFASATELTAQRLAVPDFVTCDRNKLTSWQGEVTKLRQSDNGIELGIATDYGTSESLKLTMPSWQDTLGQFRLQGQVFQAGDWEKIVDPRGSLKPRVRAVIWLCEIEGYPPIINWQPPL